MPNRPNLPRAEHFFPADHGCQLADRLPSLPIGAIDEPRSRPRSAHERHRNHDADNGRGLSSTAEVQTSYRARRRVDAQ
jgi:hypothetical protein